MSDPSHASSCPRLLPQIFSLSVLVARRVVRRRLRPKGCAALCSKS
jgi:hypothetical protein